MKGEIQSYKDLVVWQKSIAIVIEVYSHTNKFPKEELYCLISQMRRCAISIPSNIAEGRGRGTKKDFSQFLRIALGSANELETQLEISKHLKYLGDEETSFLSFKIVEIKKMINALIKSLKKPKI